MAQMAQQPILKIEIGDNCVCTQHLVGVGEARIYLIKVGPFEGLMDAIIKHYGEFHNWRSADSINDLVGTSCFILDVEVELLQICGPLLMLVILQFSLCLHELQRLMISVYDCLIPKNIMPPLAVGLDNRVHFFVVSRVLTDDIL
jgi:hypothetical protein